VLSGVSSVRILHGKGTGALRAAVREHLTGHPLVQSSTAAPAREGGDGGDDREAHGLSGRYEGGGDPMTPQEQQV